MILAQFLLRIAKEEKPIAEHTPVKDILKKPEEREGEALRIQKKWQPDTIR